MNHYRKHLYDSARTVDNPVRSRSVASKIFREHLRRELSDARCAIDAANGWNRPCDLASAENKSRSRDVSLGKIITNNDRSSLSSMPEGRDLDFERAYRTNAILIEVCKLRLKAAKRSADQEFMARNFRNIDRRALASELAEITPPRRTWRDRPYWDKSLSGDQLAFVALLAELRKAVHISGVSAPKWCRQLQGFVVSVQERVFGVAEFRFNSPQILAFHKSGNEYRALSLFALADRVIDRIAARYFRRKFDRLLSSSACAYRFRSSTTPCAEHHAVVDGIRAWQLAYRGRHLWGAECDLKKFFDCIDHSIAEAAFRAACLSIHAVGGVVDVRACKIFKAHLQCYSFQSNVKNCAPALLTGCGLAASFCWPAAELRTLHGETFSRRRIGVPQGMALSGVDANLILSFADFAVDETAGRCQGQTKYWRYCDDMLQLAETKESCATVFNAYLTALRILRLPIHSAQAVDRGQTVLKSKLPYPWADRRLCSNGLERVSFLGYDVGHNGCVTIRDGSVKKYRKKHRLFIQLLRNRIASGTLRVSPERFLRNFENRLLRMSTPHVGKSKNGSLTKKCWVMGFRSKIGHGDKWALQARALDRMRGQQLANLRIFLSKQFGRLVALPKKSAGMRYNQSYHRAFRDDPPVFDLSRIREHGVKR
jgi:hypothetical protein